MDFILGILALSQIIFLPGIILLKLFKIRREFIQTIVYSFGLSLIFNFLWVLILTMLKINIPVIHYFLFAAEIGLAGWLYRKNLFTSTEALAAGVLSNTTQILGAIKSFWQKENEENAFSRVIKNIVAIVFFIWALAGILWVGKLMVNELGTAFKLWDAVVSWNRWAGEWFNNTIPSPNRYPQLIPANFSITYSFLGSTDIQIFAKSFMPLFTLFTWLLMLDLAFRLKQPGVFIGMVFLRYMTKKFLGAYIAEGYVDVALLFFSFLTVYSLLKASMCKEEPRKLAHLYLGGIFAAGTALTKQNGLLVFGFYPILALLLVLNDSSETLTVKIKKLIKPVALGLLILLPWYILNESRLLLGLNTPNVGYLMSADRHSGRSYLERAVRAMNSLGIYKYLYVLVLVTLPLITKRFRRLALIMIFPYTIIWMFLFSIFTRNLAMVLPFLALASGIGSYELLDLFLRLGERIKVQRLKAIYYLVPLVIMIFGFGRHFSDIRLSEIQITSQKDALLTKLNQRLYDYFEDQEEFGVIMTHYPIQYLPYLEDYKLDEPFTIYKEFYEKFYSHPEVEYFLVWDQYVSDEMLDQIDFFMAEGAIDFYFEEYNLRFYKVLDRETIINTIPE